MPRKHPFVAPKIVRWITVEEASAFLQVSPEALRARLRRAARRAPDGGIEADVDGMRGRKLGASWRITFGARWTEPT